MRLLKTGLVAVAALLAPLSHGYHEGKHSYYANISDPDSIP